MKTFDCLSKIWALQRCRPMLVNSCPPQTYHKQITQTTLWSVTVVIKTGVEIESLN